MADLTEGERHSLITAASIFGIIYSGVVYLAVPGRWFLRPWFGADNDYAAVTQARVILLVWVISWLHKRVQKALTKYGGDISGWLWIVDFITSILPVVALGLGLFDAYVNRPAGGYLEWWWWQTAFIILIVIDAIKEDIAAIRRPRVRGAAPPAH